MNFNRLRSHFFELMIEISNFIIMNSRLLSRITLDPAICHGKPTTRNTRHMVESILEYLAGGDTLEDLVKSFPDLTKLNILACVDYANEVMKMKGATPEAA